MKYFDADVPELVENVGTQIKDIKIREIDGVDGNISLKNAYTLMKEKNVVTLPITKDGYLEGLITIGDIATSYMDVYDSSILSKAKTPYRNIMETLDAELFVGDETAIFDEGKVLVAANSDLVEGYIQEHDLVITGNRYETQLCAIEMNAACIIICEGVSASLTICRMAEAKGCIVLSTPHDTYTVARLNNQSMPVAHFMIKEKIDMFRTTDFVEEIREVMTKKRTRDFLILDTKGKCRGMIFRRNLLNMKKKQVILVDHNEKSQVEISKKIAGLLCSAILSDTLMFRSPTCTPADKAAAEYLAGLAGIDVEAYANEMFLAATDLCHKSEEEIFFQDFKKFSSEEVTFGISQITSLNAEELKMIGNRIQPSLEKFRENQKVDMVFFMLTDIVKESTILLYAGEDVDALLEVLYVLYGRGGKDGRIELAGVVSRKKQLVPVLIQAVEQI